MVGRGSESRRCFQRTAFRANSAWFLCRSLDGLLGLNPGVSLAISNLDHHMAVIGAGEEAVSSASVSFGIVLACLKYSETFTPLDGCSACCSRHWTSIRNSGRPMWFRCPRTSWSGAKPFPFQRLELAGFTDGAALPSVDPGAGRISWSDETAPAAHKCAAIIDFLGERMARMMRAVLLSAG